MNARASCCAFLKVRLMFALNRFVYSVENKSGNSELFHRVFTVCMCVYVHLCMCVFEWSDRETHLVPKNPWVLINSTVHIFAFIFIICCMSQNTLISSPHDALMPFFYYCNTTPQLTGECQVSSKLCTNVLVVRLMETFVHSALVFNDVLKTLAQKCYLYIIYWSFLWDYLIESVLNVDNCFKMFKKHLKVTFL